MIKYLTYIAPLILKAPRRNPVKQLAGLLLSYSLIGIAIIFLFIAGFIHISKLYGTEVAFAATGITMLLAGSILITLLSRPKSKHTPLPPKIANDPLAKYVPESIKENPTVQKLLYQIGESPVTATATAVTIGMLLSKELFEETK